MTTTRTTRVGVTATVRRLIAPAALVLALLPGIGQQLWQQHERDLAVAAAGHQSMVSHMPPVISQQREASLKYRDYHAGSTELRACLVPLSIPGGLVDALLLAALLGLVFVLARRTRAGIRAKQAGSQELKERQGKSRRNQERSRSIAEVIPDIIIQTNAAGEYLDVITGDESKLLRPTQELVGTKVTDRLPERAAARVLGGIRRALDTGDLQTVEYQLDVPAGALHFEARLVPATEDTVTALIRDITERKLDERQKRFQLLFQRIAAEAASALAGVATDKAFDRVVDATLCRLGQFFQADRSYLFRFSGDLERMSNTHEWCGEGIEPHKDRIQDMDTRAMSWWRSRIMEDGIVHLPRVADLPPEAEAEREEFGMQDIRSLICLATRGTGGEITGFIGFDMVRREHQWPEEHITMLQLIADTIGNALERRRAEGALAHFVGEQKLLLDNIQTQIWYLTDPDAYGAVNRAHAEFIGVAPEEMAFRPMHRFLPEDVVEACHRSNGQVFLTGEQVDTEEWMPNSFGEKRLLSIRKSPRLRSDGSVEFVVCSAEDITDRKQAEEDRERLQAQYVQAQKMESVGRLAGGLAHDFNNMLVAVMGYADLVLAQMEDDAPYRADILEIQKVAQRSAELIRQLLAFSRKQAISPRPLDLNQSVTSVRKMLERLVGENVELVWAPARQPSLVKMDPSQLNQILTNLCVNASDAIQGTGRIVMGIETKTIDEAYLSSNPTAELDPGEYMVLYVKDNGCGMSPETLARLFEPFFTTKSPGIGTGLGLPTVYGIVKQNNGHIEVESKVGVGTTFRILIPPYRQQPEPASARDVNASSGTRPAAKDEHRRILLVEDEPAILRLIKTMLEELGYTVFAAASPGKALQLAKEESGRFDLLISDVVMPGMNGMELANNLLSSYPGLKCLLISGYTADVIAHHAALEPGLPFMEKPFSQKQLAAKVMEVLEQDQGKDQEEQKEEGPEQEEGRE